MKNIILRTNPERFNMYSGLMKKEEIEHAIEIATRKYFRSIVTKTKAQALLEEIEGYYARNREYNLDICDFNTYVKHWTHANRGVIPDLYLDIIERQFGKLDGLLYIVPKTSSWNTTKDWRTEQKVSQANEVTNAA